MDVKGGRLVTRLKLMRDFVDLRYPVHPQIYSYCRRATETITR